MKIEDFAYVVETGKSFDDAVVSVLKAVEQKGWTLFQIYDIKERLAAKGFSQKPLKIIEICKGKHADTFLNKNRLISLCLPCKINVIEDDGVKIVGMNPKIMAQFFSEVSEEEAEEVFREIKRIVDDSK